MKIEIQEEDMLKIEVGDLVHTKFNNDPKLVVRDNTKPGKYYALINLNTNLQSYSGVSIEEMIETLDLVLIAKKDNIKLTVER